MFKQGPERPQISTDKKSWRGISCSMPELVSYFSLSFRQQGTSVTRKVGFFV